jgi:hypothetical protein
MSGVRGWRRSWAFRRTNCSLICTVALCLRPAFLASFGRRRVLSDGKGQLIEGDSNTVSCRLIDGDVVVAAAEVLNESMSSGKDAGRPESLESAHRSKPGFEAAMIGLDPIVRVLLRGVQRPWDQLVEDRR